MKRLLFLIVPCILVACASSPLPATKVPTESWFERTKLFAITAEAETRTSGYPANGATITSIMATKHAGGTAMAATMTAQPTETFTPTIPSDSPVCRPQDLQPVYFGSMGATQSIVIGVGVTNISKMPCFLQTWPQVRLVDRTGKPLDIQYSYTATADTPVDPHAMLGLPPGRMAGFDLGWENWCLPSVEVGVSIRLTLARNGGTIAVPTDLTGEGLCNDPGYKSYVGIFPFSMP